MQPDFPVLVGHFQIHGEILVAQAYGNGHINDTYCLTMDQGGARVRYILQRINHRVFRDPLALMENIQCVTAHIAGKCARKNGLSRRVLTLIPTRQGLACHRDEEGHYWRSYVFIENARTYDEITSPSQAFEAAKAFGQFQAMLADLPASRLHETIPDFHHTPKRFACLEAAIAADPADRVQLAQPEIEFVLERKAITSMLLDAKLVERVTHNDTKINNVMLDDATGAGICVIDLDTVMPGLAPYDFGDLVRSATCPAKEDERDLTKVVMHLPMFEALARGYLTSASEFLTKAEKQWLVFSGKLITFESAIRFLTDFLMGDIYFKVHGENHNLDRCRTQLKLVQSIEQQEAPMNRLVECLGQARLIGSLLPHP